MKEISKHYNPSEVEPKWRGFWEKNNIYKFNPKAKGEIFSVDTPPPTLGEHNADIYGALGISGDEQAQLKSKGVI